MAVRTGMDPWAIAELRRTLARSRRDGARRRGLRGTRLPVAASEPMRHHARGVDGGAARGGPRSPRFGDPPGLPPARRRRSDAAPRLARRMVRRPGSGVGVRGRGAGGARRGPRARRLRGTGGQGRAPRVPGGGVRHRWSRPTSTPSGPASFAPEPHGSGCTRSVLAQDATAPALRGTFDRILVDAPCSGMGSARRRPELLWRPRKDDLSRLARLQVAITVASADLLAPGGRLVYSVCTFPRAETEAACDAIVRHRPDLRPATIDGPDGSAARVRLWPHRHGTDGMFVAAFVKPA